MTTLVFKGPDEAEKIEQFKTIAKALGYSIERSSKGHTQRTKTETEFIEAYKEAKAFERGEINLPTLEEVLSEIKAKKVV